MAAAGCADPNRRPVTDGDVAWETCALQADGDGPPTQCATVEMPLWWDDPDAGSIELFAQRHLSGADDARVLWMLPGGPGQTGAVFESYVKALARELPRTDLYVFEHRGVGRSTRLSCPDAEDVGSDDGIDVTLDEWPGCIEHVVAEWGDDLAAFSSTEAAHDLAEWIRLTASGREVFVYGGSYGTTLGHRFLQHHDDLVDGVILDSLALDVDHRVYDAEFDDVGRELLARCAEDERCVEALGDDPEATATAAMAAVREAPCGVVDADTLRLGAGAFLADPSLRGFAPSLFSRALRCNADDQADLDRLVGLFTDRDPHYTEILSSPVLYRNIELSEQWPEPWPTAEELGATQEAALFGLDIGPDSRVLLETWPRYPWERAVDDALAVTDTPVLLFHGGLDPQTPAPRSEAAFAHFDGPGQHGVFFPDAAHIVLRATPGPGGDCATRLLRGFLDDPLAEPDTSCVDGVRPLDFDGQPLTSALLMGGCSRYGEGCDGGKASALPLLALLGLARRRARTYPASNVRDRRGPASKAARPW
jgi:pimeloyl-ACP methyl ester carboxylesterase